MAAVAEQTLRLNVILPPTASGGAASGSPAHAFVFNNASQSPIYEAYREMRTERLLDFGWRTEADLIDGVDHDKFDEVGTKTIHIVVTDDQHKPVGCSRITVIGPDEIRTAISPSMWGPLMDTLPIPAEVLQASEAGTLVDMNRLLNMPGAGFDEAAVVIGAAVAATRSRYGSLFTAGAALIRLVKWLGVPNLVLHDGKLGGRRAQLIYIPPHAWGEVSSPRAKESLALGAALFEQSEEASVRATAEVITTQA